MIDTPAQTLSTGRAPARSVLANPRAIAEIAVRLMLPCLVFGTAFVQYRDEMFVNQVLNVLGQALIWIATLSAAIIVFVIQRAVRVFLFAFIAIIALRVARLNLGPIPELEIGYHLATGLLFGVAGATIFIHRVDVLYRQMMVFVALSIPMMLLQMLGVPWSHALRTEDDGSIADYELGSLLFQSDQGVGFNTLQLRPAGLLHASVFLSIVMLPTMAIHFSRWRGGRIDWRDVSVLGVVALAMSKILILATMIFALWYFVAGPSVYRLRMTKYVGVAGVLLLLYSVLFPSAFSYNLSPEIVYINFSIRLADLQAVLAGLPVTEVVVEGWDNTVLRRGAYAAGEQSAISVLARYWQVVLILFFAIGVLLIFRLRALQRIRPEVTSVARNGLIAALLALLITPFLGSPFYSFWAGGFVIMPFLIRNMPRPRSARREQPITRFA